MNELKIGKRYTYKNHVYEIVNLGCMKLDEYWVDAVGYKRVIEGGANQHEKADTTVYTRSRDMFEELFLPQTLELKDTIIAVSMGKILKEYIVTKVYNQANSVHYSVLSNGSKCNLVTSNLIGFNGRVYVMHPDDSLSHINCVEYYFMSNKVRKIITRKEKIEKIRNKLIAMDEVFGNIDIANFKADDILDKYSNELSDIIIEIQKDGYIK